MKELPQDLPSRYLNDTRYMSREARDYLRIICPTVRATKGGLTAKLRYFWGLNGILREGEKNPQNKKNREDHRHHAIDAAVIALTSVGALHRLSRANAIDGRVHADDFQPPWAGFRADVAGKVKSMIVSHRSSRKITGALHEETNYGKTGKAGVFVFRKPVEALTDNMVENIRDEAIRLIIQKGVERHGDMKKAAAAGFFIVGNDGRKFPIKRVRVLGMISDGSYNMFKDAQGNPYRAAPYGNNHHVELFESPDGKKWEGRFVTAMEAARRARISKTAIINRQADVDKQGWKFVMSLSNNDMLRIGNDGKGEVYRVQNMSGPNNKITFRTQFTASTDAKDAETVLRTSPNSLKSQGAKKIIVTVIGEERPAHD